MLRLLAQVVPLLCILFAGGAPARGLDLVSVQALQGTWQGEKDDRSIVWRVESGSRLRVDDRPADLTILGDTLIVRFDASVAGGSACGREIAVYRFRTSGLDSRNPRLFVYGFDLGLRGLWLERQTVATPPLPEDAAPSAPQPRGQTTPSDR